ncbi:MAG: DUF2066 domain-containing protein [Idiomarina sp.]|nr:DUF2066 domain-containing protein [Idiomarina sp.]
MRFVFVISSVLIFWLSSFGNALANDSFAQLLQAEVEVNDQSRAQRQRELPNLFQEVLVRVSGTTEVVRHSIVRSELSSVNDYLLQFGYRREGDSTYLQASFDEQRIRQLLQRAGYPMWTGERPQLLLWLAENSPSRGIRLVSRSEEREFLTALYSESQRRGMQMLMPLMDLEDQLAVGPRDVWSRFQREVVRATERYPVAGLVSARMFPITGDDGAESLQLEAIVVVGEREFNETVNADSEAELARALVNQVTDRVANVFIGSSDSDHETIRVRFSGFADITQLLAAEQLLQQQGQVDQVHLSRYQQGMLEFVVQVRGSSELLVQALAFERRIEALPMRSDHENNEVVLEYRWLR